MPGFHRKIAEWAKLTENTEFCKSNDNKFDLVSVPEGAEKYVFFPLF